MPTPQFSPEEMALFNSKLGYYTLLKRKKLNLQKVLEELHYYTTLRNYQEELIKLQNWVIDRQEKVVVVFEGRDAAGKGGAIRRITEYINPRHYRIVALNIPSEDERNQWFFQRYINHLPKPGEIVFFDRSWYNRAVVEPVNGFCTAAEYERFMSQVNDFERMLVESNIYYIKFYFSISKEEQASRFAEIKSNPLKRWKITPVDEKAQELWDEYTRYKKRMHKATHTPIAPWIIIVANKKTEARIKAISHILNVVPYT
ncbi:MAG: polyphosphate kinase 2 [Flavobacteriaceae bacterium]